MTEQPAESQREPVNFLQSASNIVITGGSFVGVQHNYDPKEISGQNSSLDILYTRVASNAILNAGGRADEVRCHPGTREEVIGVIEKWIDGNGDLSRSIFWLSGPAGAGKSAIIQTIAERCIQRNVLMANYFFFRADTSRNNAGSVAATLLYQIFAFYPALKAEITTLLNKKPLIFDQSIRDQIKYLIDNPVRAILGKFAHTHRLVLLIDGLDECSQEAKRVQKDLLRALHHLSSQEGSPFVVLVASRAEPHLVMAFSEIGLSKDSIFLDDNYRPSNDIHAFVTVEFDKIKKHHHLGRTLGGDWPSKASIEEIVEKSSGQFIYAAIVMRFISSSPASPAYSLDKVRGIRPIVKNSPFAELDAIYTHILSQAENWDLAKDVIASGYLVTSVIGIYGSLDCLSEATTRALVAPLGHTEFEVESSFSDLLALMKYDRDSQTAVFYHASLQDFLLDQSRSKALYMDLDMFATKLAIAHFQAISSFWDVQLFFCIFSFVSVATPRLKNALVSCKPRNIDTLGIEKYKVAYSICRGIGSLSSLYNKEDNLFYQTVLQKWLMWFSDLEIPMGDCLEDDNFDCPPEAIKIWNDIRRSRTVKALPKARVAFWNRRGFSRK